MAKKKTIKKKKEVSEQVVDAFMNLPGKVHDDDIADIYPPFVYQKEIGRPLSYKPQ